MNYKILFQKLYVVLIVLLAVVVHLAEPVEVVASEQTSGAVGGAVTTFGFNNPAEISNVRIIDASGAIAFENTNPGNVSSLTRMQEFSIEFEVDDVDGFDHLDFYIALFNTDAVVSDSGLLLTAINSGVSDRGIVIRWISPERSTYFSGIVSSGIDTFNPSIAPNQNFFFVKSGVSAIDITNEGSSYNSGLSDFITTTQFNDSSGTWVINSGAVATSVVIRSGIVNTFSGTTVTSSGIRNLARRVTIPFRMSKVAPSTGVWNLGIVVHDRLQLEVDETRTEELVVSGVLAAGAYRNQWYGEVEILSLSTAVQFIDAPAAGANFLLSNPSGVAGIQLRFISNGLFQQQVQTSSTWEPVVTSSETPDFAFLIPNSGITLENDYVILRTEGNRFALRARRTQFNTTPEDSGVSPFVDILPKTSGNTDADVLVPPSDDGDIYASVRGTSVQSEIATILDGNTGTDEFGITSRFEFGLRASRIFESGEYNGTISIGISNSSGAFGTNN